MGSVVELLRDDVVTRVVPLGEGPVSVGADLGNVLVIDDPEVSAFHLVLSPCAEGLVVVDLQSTNGTAVNGQRVASPAPVRPGDAIALGNRVRLRIREAPARTDGTGWALREVASGLIHALAPPGLRIGSGPRSDVRIEAGPDEVAQVRVHDHEVWLATPDEVRELALGEAFSIGGCAFELVAYATRDRTTLYDVAGSLPFRLVARLDSGPTAVLSDPSAAREHVITAEARATLLYLLARRRRADLDAGLESGLAGWCHDEDLALGIWGRAAWSLSASRFSVLIHRTRRDISDAGFDPWFLEKRRGATRVALDDVEVR